MLNVTESDTNTFAEVSRVLNVLIDENTMLNAKICQMATANDTYNAEVDKHNESIGFKKGGK